MALYKKKKEAAGPKPVVLVNPVGRVVEVVADAPEVELAREGDGGWKLATKEQVAQLRKEAQESVKRGEKDRAETAARVAEAEKSAKVATELRR